MGDISLWEYLHCLSPPSSEWQPYPYLRCFGSDKSSYDCHILSGFDNACGAESRFERAVISNVLYTSAPQYYPTQMHPIPSHIAHAVLHHPLALVKSLTKVLPFFHMFLRPKSALKFS